VREHEHGVARGQPPAVEVAVGPVDDDPGVAGEAGAARERRPRVDDRHPVADLAGHPRQRGAEVDRPEDDHGRG